MPQSDGETEAQGDQGLAEVHSGVRTKSLPACVCVCPHLTLCLSPPLLLVQLHYSWNGLLLSLTGRSGASGFASLSLSLGLWRMELVVVTSQGLSEAPNPEGLKASGMVPGEKELLLL